MGEPTPDAARLYADIIDRPRPVSRRHAPMARADRAKQFMPFAALRGYEDVIEARQAIYEPRVEPSEEDRAELDRRLNAVAAALRRGERPRVTLEIFEPRPGDPDELGRYRTLTGAVEKLWPEKRELRVDGMTVAFGAITEIWPEEE